jgi:hypothetical protein
MLERAYTVLLACIVPMIGLGQGFRGSKFHSRPWIAFGMRIYEKSVGFVSLDQNLEPNLLLFGKRSIFNEDFGSLFNAFFFLSLEPADIVDWVIS